MRKTDNTTGAGDWAASGAMALTGRRDGPPLLAPGNPATFVRHRLADLGLDIPGILGERAAYAGLARNGPWSCGGAFRIVPTADGHLGISLPRRSDIELLPALVEAPLESEPWQAVTEWAASHSTADAEERLRLLGLAGGAVPATPPTDRPGVIQVSLGNRHVTDSPIVIDFTSLWAGPLCAHLLGLGSARIIKVESAQRPDGARFGPARFFDLLHSGHHFVQLDFKTQLDELRSLVANADLVLESSRPRALRQLGIIAEEVVASGTSWLSITARGRASNSVGFGDDIAAAAGLVVRDQGDILPCGDALADPLTGVAAATAATAALASPEAQLIDVSMLHVSSEAATAAMQPVEHTVHRKGDSWWLEAGGHSFKVAEPWTRS